jgi:hypothetical protein
VQIGLAQQGPVTTSTQQALQQGLQQGLLQGLLQEWEIFFGKN